MALASIEVFGLKDPKLTWKFQSRKQQKALMKRIENLALSAFKAHFVSDSRGGKLQFRH